jgi:lysophospholipase L1-like esterase
VEGVIFTQFPIDGPVKGAGGVVSRVLARERKEGTDAWNAIAAEMAKSFPGKVMYLPVASSLLLDGRFSTWLPPLGEPSAPKDQWIRARKLDNVHLCPEGAARYARAILTDLTDVIKLAPAPASWAQGSWTTNPDYNDPPGACPDDHP